MKKRYVLIGVIVALFPCSLQHAMVWYVHPDSALNSIQAGLDSCIDNDTVLVGPGIYYENLAWPNTQGIHLMSELGPDTTIIDGASAGRVIGIDTEVDSTTIINGFTIRNGYALWTQGGGIYCNTSSPMIAGNIITSNTAYDTMLGTQGGGIYCNESSSIIADNTITDNTADFGGGIYCSKSSSVITDNTIAGNDAIEGGGICCFPYSSPIIIDNTIIGNHANYGGGIYGNGSSPVITDNIIVENTADFGGGGSYFSASSPVITNNTIVENTADYGAGIRCDHSSPLIAGNTITDNIAYYAGGIWIWRSTQPITGNTIAHNTGDFGAGIYCFESSPFIDSCTISNNNGDGIFCESYMGGPSNPVIHYNNITDNNGYGIRNIDPRVIIDAENNWWGDASGPYHSIANPGGLGDSVSDYVDFDPWLIIIGLEEQSIIRPIEKHENLGATIFSGPLLLPEGIKCRIFDITGRVVTPDRMRPGIYFVEIDGQITQKVVKVR